MRAFCYASGHIKFGRRLPSTALPIASGPSRQLLGFIEPHARHAYDGKALLVPGIPEAPDQLAAVRALEKWLDRLKPLAPKGIRVS